MLFFNPEITVWIYQDKVDMRKQIDGLSIIVSSDMDKNPCKGGVFLFFNKHLNKVKTLHWHKNGFALYYKRLEKEKFKIPRNKESINYEQLCWLLSGLDINNLQEHKQLDYNTFF
jgi:transposase